MREPKYRIHYRTSELIGAWYGGMIPELDNDPEGIVNRVVKFSPGTKVEKVVEVASGKVVWPIPKPREIPIAFYPGNGTRRIVGTAEVYDDGQIFAKIFDADRELNHPNLKSLFVASEQEDDRD